MSEQCTEAEKESPSIRLSPPELHASVNIRQSAKPTNRVVPEYPTKLADTLEKFHQIANSLGGNCAPRVLYEKTECGNLNADAKAAIADADAGLANRIPTLLVVTNKATANACMDLVERGKRVDRTVPFVRFTVIGHGNLEFDDPDPCFQKAMIVAALVRNLVELIGMSRGKIIMVHCEMGLNRSIAVFLTFDLYYCQTIDRVTFDDLNSTYSDLETSGFRPQTFQHNDGKTIWRAISGKGSSGRWRITLIAAFYILKREDRMRSKSD